MGESVVRRLGAQKKSIVSVNSRASEVNLNWEKRKGKQGLFPLMLGRRETAMKLWTREGVEQQRIYDIRTGSLRDLFICGEGGGEDRRSQYNGCSPKRNTFEPRVSDPLVSSQRVGGGEEDKAPWKKGGQSD